MQTTKKQSRKRLTKAQRRRRRRVRRVAWRATLSVLTVIGLVLVGALCAGHAAFKGPSPTVGDLLTVSMLETSALKFVPRIYYSKDEVEAIVARNSVTVEDDETDTSLVVIESPPPRPPRRSWRRPGPGRRPSRPRRRPRPAPRRRRRT